MPDADETGASLPSLAEWAGGAEAIRRLFTRFYERVPLDPVLAPIFVGSGADHAAHVAAFVSEVLGAGTPYSENGGTHAQMIGHHLMRHLTETQRRTWVALLLDTADQVGLPSDPEFRASLVGYLEWGSRLAVMNSQEGAEAPDAAAPMPAWSWTSPGGPFLAPS